MLEYANNGLIGLLTPQANTIAEAELSILLPPGVGLLTSRLISTKSSMNDRLIEYIHIYISYLYKYSVIVLQ